MNKNLTDSSFVRTAPPLEADSRPQFPLHVLPGVIRQLVEEGAASLHAPSDLIAVPLLTFVAATIGNSQRIKLKEGWEERPIIYSAVVSRPGTAKSPAQKIAKKPLDVLQRSYHDQYVNERAEYEDGGKLRLPSTYRHIYTTDATMEALAPMAASSPGLVVIHDELIGWVNGQDAYRGGKGSDRQKWLSGWSGDDLKIDRKGSEPILVEDPVICVTGGIQPDVLPQIITSGRQIGTDGFIERILWSWPEEVWPSWNENELSVTTQDEVARLFTVLRNQQSTLPVRMSREAKDQFAAWYVEHNARLAGAVGLSQTMYAKMPVHLARLALILHCLKYPSSPSTVEVTTSTMRDAIELTDYFRAHALLVLGAGREVESRPNVAKGLPLRISGILQSRACEWTTRSDISKALGHNQKADDIDSALMELSTAGLAEMCVMTTGGRPATVWRCVRNERTNEESAA